MEEEDNNETNIIEKHENEPMGNKNLEDLEQRVHELDAKWKQVKEERDSIMLENEELQEQLDMANSAQSAGNIRMNEFRNDLNKVTEEVARLEYMCTSQEHELKTVSDKMCDLNSIKETVKVSNHYVVANFNSIRFLICTTLYLSYDVFFAISF